MIEDDLADKFSLQICSVHIQKKTFKENGA